MLSHEVERSFSVLIFSDVLDRFPELQIAEDHFKITPGKGFALSTTRPTLTPTVRRRACGMAMSTELPEAVRATLSEFTAAAGSRYPSDCPDLARTYRTVDAETGRAIRRAGAEGQARK